MWEKHKFNAKAFLYVEVCFRERNNMGPKFDIIECSHESRAVTINSSAGSVRSVTWEYRKLALARPEMDLPGNASTEGDECRDLISSPSIFICCNFSYDKQTTLWTWMRRHEANSRWISNMESKNNFKSFHSMCSINNFDGGDWVKGPGNSCLERNSLKHSRATGNNE